MLKESKTYDQRKSRATSRDKNLPKKACPERPVVNEVEPNRRVYIRTFGCQMNEYDSNIIKGLLLNTGFKEVSGIDEADYILINTCTVREKADNKVYSLLGSLRELKKIIGVCGCLAEKDGIKLIEKMPHVNFVVGPRRIKEIPSILDRLGNGENHIVCTGDSNTNGICINSGHHPKEGTRENGTVPIILMENGYVTIMQGCSNYCSYCVVPYVRGESKSRKIDEIIAEIKNLTESGIKEITLLGQNVNSYGKDLNSGISFADLLKEIIKIKKVEIIKFMTSHPKDVSGDLMDLIAKEPKMYKRIHLPVQSGSNRILKLMNRGYTREKYLEIIKDIRGKIPGASITTDIIVGFPSETEKDFEDTLDLVKEAKFDAAYTFKYSIRSSTPASKMDGEIDRIVKEQRLKKLMEIIDKTIIAKKQK